jgi:hypothetical protein
LKEADRRRAAIANSDAVERSISATPQHLCFLRQCGALDPGGSLHMFAP